MVSGQQRRHTKFRPPGNGPSIPGAPTAREAEVCSESWRVGELRNVLARSGCTLSARDCATATESRAQSSLALRGCCALTSQQSYHFLGHGSPEMAIPFPGRLTTRSQFTCVRIDALFLPAVSGRVSMSNTYDEVPVGGGLDQP